MTGDFRHRCAVADSCLKAWGEWVARRAIDEHGLPHDTSFVGKVGRSSIKSAIPIKIMPKRVAQVSRILANLPTNWREALSVHYVLDIGDDGERTTIEERAEWLELTVRAYQYRVSQGRKEFARRMP